MCQDCLMHVQISTGVFFLFDQYENTQHLGVTGLPEILMNYKIFITILLYR